MKNNFYIFLWFALIFLREISALEQPKCFPSSFKFGVATAAFQIEGAWNVTDKGESIWDYYTHKYPDRIFDHTSADVADDSYHNIQEDVKMIKELGVSFYRFSISWTRVLPNGLNNYVSSDGIRYYNTLIDLLLKNNITPLVTIYHWDLPQSLQDLGGWTNPVVADYFVDYAEVLFKHFGDRVANWVTFNEPLSFCHDGYGYFEAPGRNATGVEDYLCGHNVLKAHGMVYRLYDEKFRPELGGAIGIVLDFPWMEPATTAPRDEVAAEIARQFAFGWFAHPILTEGGDYPLIMRDKVDRMSKAQNYSRSRLPVFTTDEIKMIQGSYDFLGLNHYTTYLVKARGPSSAPFRSPSYEEDQGVTLFQKPEWPKSSSSWLRVVPWGFRKVLNWIKTTYNNPLLIITENGISLPEGLSDSKRVQYMDGYLSNLWAAVEEDGCNVKGYTHWSLMDNFEWMRGYSERFGLYQVDFTSPNRTRIPRLSASYYNQVIRTGCLPVHLSEDHTVFRKQIKSFLRVDNV